MWPSRTQSENKLIKKVTLYISKGTARESKRQHKKTKYGKALWPLDAPKTIPSQSRRNSVKNKKSILYFKRHCSGEQVPTTHRRNDFRYRTEIILLFPYSLLLFLIPSLNIYDRVLFSLFKLLFILI